GAKIGRRRDGRGHLSVRDEPDEHRHHHEQYAADHPQPRLDQHGVDRVLEGGPPLLVVAHVDEHADEDGHDVLEHDALRNDGASGQDRNDPLDHDIGGDHDRHGLPERVGGITPHAGRSAWAHLCAARNCAKASSCEAVIMLPNVLGMMPASFSYPLAIDDMGSRIFLRIDSASRREPTWVRSGAITWPWPSSL